MNVPAVCAINQATLALYAARRTSGIVVNIGFQVTSIVPRRLGRELHGLLPPSVSNGITVVPPPYGADTAWFGAKIISNLSTFPGPWCVTKKQFRQKSKIKLMWGKTIWFIFEHCRSLYVT
ncbi:actin-related protein 8-like isoform X1 [Malus domestica]|uniref:actin-related protein 8-like isoform X1 n=1 Tax=Malus domestica TaxID=3750 RepID=UPI0010AB25E2|nr:actin-related protein 8-like [Malus domestica]